MRARAVRGGSSARAVGRRGSGVVASCRARLLELARRPTTWIIVGLVPGYLLLLQYGNNYLLYRQAIVGQRILGFPIGSIRASLLPDQLVQVALGTGTTLGVFLALALGAVVAGGEYDLGVTGTILAQRPARLAVYVGQILATATLLVLAVALAFGAAAGASAMIALAEGERPIAWPPAAEVARGLLVAYLILATWAALGICLGTLLRGAAGAIGVGLVWLGAVEGTVTLFAFQSPVLRVLVQALPGANVGSLVATFGTVGGGRNAAVRGLATGSAAQFALVLAAYLISALAIGAVVIQRRDIR